MHFSVHAVLCAALHEFGLAIINWHAAGKQLESQGCTEFEYRKQKEFRPASSCGPKSPRGLTSTSCPPGGVRETGAPESSWFSDLHGLRPQHFTPGQCRCTASEGNGWAKPLIQGLARPQITDWMISTYWLRHCEL